MSKENPKFVPELLAISKRTIGLEAFQSKKTTGKKITSMATQILFPYVNEAVPLASTLGMREGAGIAFVFDVASDIVAPIVLLSVAKVEPSLAIPSILAIKASYNAFIGFLAKP